jgi:hypothetical protein
MVKNWLTIAGDQQSRLSHMGQSRPSHLSLKFSNVRCCPESRHSSLRLGSPIGDHRSVRLNGSQPYNQHTMTTGHRPLARQSPLRWLYGSRLLSAPTRYHQSDIAVFGVPSFLGMRKKGCRGSMFHENCIGFFSSYIRDGSLEEGRHGGGWPVQYPPGLGVGTVINSTVIGEKISLFDPVSATGLQSAES